MKRIIGLFILMSLVVSLSAQVNLNPKVEKLVGAIAEGNMFMSSAVGYGGQKPQQWDNYLQLKRKASEVELIALTDHENPAVRCYAFLALTENNSAKVFDILIKHLKDSDYISTMIGCIMSQEYVGDFFLDLVINGFTEKTVILDEAQAAQIDSILLFDPAVKLAARTTLLENLEPKERYYQRIKEIYTEDGEGPALVCLAKYQRATDKNLISKQLLKADRDEQFFGLKAVRYFPHSAFFPLLQKIHQAEIAKTTGFNYYQLRMLYSAVVQYQTQESKNLLEQTLKNTTAATKQYHSEFIWLALTKYPAPVFEGMIDKIEISDFAKNKFTYWLEQE